MIDPDLTTLPSTLEGAAAKLAGVARKYVGAMNTDDAIQAALEELSVDLLVHDWLESIHGPNDHLSGDEYGAVFDEFEGELSVAAADLLDQEAP